MRLIISAAILSLAMFSSPAFACGPEVHIQFFEESPDRFRIKFVRGPKLRLVTLFIALEGSAAGAIFDDYEGLEMQGPQPGPSGVTIRSIKYRSGGGEDVTVTFDGFTEQRFVDFHSDLDDNARAADPDQNHIYDGELEGAMARAFLISDKGRRIEIEGRFDNKGNARLGDRACV